jgi:hypothetical protein
VIENVKVVVPEAAVPVNVPGLVGAVNVALTVPAAWATRKPIIPA